MKIPFNKTIVIYGLLLAALAFFVEWLEYRVFLKTLSTEFYIVILAILFTGLGVWVGRFLSAKPKVQNFVRNINVIKSLSITERELEVLEFLAKGSTNKEIAEKLFVAESTIKTHLISLYKKLDVERRTQAVQKARSLQIVP